MLKGAGWRVRPRWAAALLIRLREDLLERFRDHAVAGGVRMEVRPRCRSALLEVDDEHAEPVLRLNDQEMDREGRAVVGRGRTRFPRASALRAAVISTEVTKVITATYYGPTHRSNPVSTFAAASSCSFNSARRWRTP